MPGETRIVFALGARLHKSAAEIEALSAREIAAWVEYFSPAANDAADGAVDVRSLTRTQLRAMFHHGHG